MVKAGDIVIVDFPGAQGTKRRPAVVVSSGEYHQNRPDVIVGLLTSQTQVAIHPTDHILQDWQSAGLREPSAFRSYLITLHQSVALTTIGKVSDHDWPKIAECLERAIAL